MKRKMMRYAMLYISELEEEAFPEDETMTPEKFMEITETTFRYEEIENGSRIDAILSIIQNGEIEASFTFNIGR